MVKGYETAVDVLKNKAHNMAKEKGFWEDGENRNRGELLALIHAEVSEALECHRKDQRCANATVIKAIKTENDDEFKEIMRNKVKDTYENEIADVFIRLFDLCGAEDINILAHINAKMRYNAMRPHKHGKNY